MSWDESADYSTDVVVPKWNFGKLIAIPGGPGPSGPPGPKGDTGEPGPVGPPGASLTEVATAADLPAGQAPGTVALTVDTGDLYRADGTKADGWQRISERVPSTGIEDSTLVGRSVVTAADERAARAATLSVGKTRAATGVATTDATILTDALALDSHVRVEDGVFLIPRTGVNIAASKTLRVAAGASLKVPDGELSAVNTATVTRVVRLYSGSRFEGTINGNRAGQDKTAFNAAGGENAGITHCGVYANVAPATPLKNLWVDATVTGVVDKPLYFENVHDSYVRLRASDCGGPVYFKGCRNIYVDLVVDSSDNKDWRVWQHAVDFVACSGVRGRVVIKGQRGTGTSANGTGLSPWISGLTMIDCSDIQFDSVDVEFADLTGQQPGVGLSLLGCSRMSVAQTRIVGYSDVLLELGGVVDSTFSNLKLDGRYQTSAANTAGRGVALYNLSQRTDFKGRTNEYTSNVKFDSGVIRRCRGAAAEFNKAVGTSWENIDFTASKFGCLFEYRDVEVGNQPGQVKGDLRNHTFINCRFTWNERSGFQAWDVQAALFHACRSSNNGQAITAGGCRDGSVADNDSSGFITRQLDSNNQVKGTPKPNMAWFGCAVEDTQNYTAPGFLDPNNGSVIAVDLPERYGVGQVIKIAGAGAAGADLTTYIKDIVHDEMVLGAAVTTFPTATLTGTIAVSGTTITGTGTSFLSDLTGRVYIKVGSEYRRVNRVSSNTAATVESAFSASVPAGTALVVVRATVTATPSQRYGYWLSADTVDPVVLASRQPAGHVVAPFHDPFNTARTLISPVKVSAAVGQPATVEVTGPDASHVLALKSKGAAGAVTADGVQVETKGHTHTVAQVTGAAQWVSVPASATATGTPGQLAADAAGTFLYVCVAANTWRRVALTAW